MFAAMKKRQKKTVQAPSAPRMRRQVLVLVETSRAYGRGLVQGVAHYNREHGGWSIYFKPHGLGDPPPPWLRDWQGDGILVRIGDRRMADAVKRTGVPAVDLRGLLTDTELPFIGVDHPEVARLAAEHLLERGFHHFGFCGLPRGVHPHMDSLSDHFRALIEKAGHTCDVFKARHGPLPGEAWEHQQSRAGQWIDQQERIARWVESLPKPAGVMACHDDRAVQVLDACRRTEISVPDAVAVIGVDNDQHLCELSIPPLSSIDEQPGRIGYEAAALLDRLMAGKPRPKGPVLVPPRAVVARQSTDVLATEDQAVARAVRYIRQTVGEGIRVRDVVAQGAVSRVTLAARFKRILGRTIREEIQRVQIAQVKELLATTNLPIKQVARRAGFHYVEYMSRLFCRLVGEPPARYRKHFRH
jgi:LacI family transcriptional regulator